MSFLFVTLLVFGLVVLIVQRARGIKDYAIISVVLILCLALAACSDSSSAAPTPTHSMGSVHYGTSYNQGHLYLEVDVRGDDQVKELTLTFDREVGNYDMVDACVLVTSQGEGTSYVWFAAMDGYRGIIRYTGKGTELTKGKYILDLEYRLHRDIQDPAKDYWTTPKVLTCKVTTPD